MDSLTIVTSFLWVCLAPRVTGYRELDGGAAEMPPPGVCGLSMHPGDTNQSYYETAGGRFFSTKSPSLMLDTMITPLLKYG